MSNELLGRLLRPHTDSKGIGRWERACRYATLKIPNWTGVSASRTVVG